MATRNERVVLSLQDNFSSGMARAAAATAATSSALKTLDGQTTKVERDNDRLGKSAVRLGDGMGVAAGATRTATVNLGAFSGSVSKFGPALAVAAPLVGGLAVSVGASLVPAITGLTAGLGAAAGAAGVTMLAFSGLGDAMESIDKARTDPTIENLAAMETELNNLGTAGRDFALYLDGLRPILNDLQNTAREGMFPGAEQGIDQLLTRLPEIDRLVGTISQTLGDLAADAGAALAGSGFDEFFDYMQTSAAPILSDFASAIGNVGRGIGNLLSAMGPATDDFTSGLADAARDFADWAANVDETQGFQDFLSFVREEGPQVVDILGGLGQIGIDVAKGLAPVGDVLTDIGGPLADFAHLMYNTPASGIGLVNTIRDLAGGADSAANPIRKMGDAAEGWAADIAAMGDSAGQSASEISGLSDALRELQGLLSARAAARNFEQAIDDAGQAVKDGALNFDIATERGRALVGAFDDVAESGSQAAQKAFDEGSFRKSIGFYDQTIAKLREFGRLSPGAAKAVQPLIQNVRNLRRDTREAIKLKIEAENGQANRKIGETEGKAKKLQANNPRVDIKADNSDANSKIDQTGKKSDDLDRKSPKVKTDAVVTSTLQKLGAVDTEAKQVDSSDPTVNVDAQDSASGVLNSVGGLISSLNGRTATTYVYTRHISVGNPAGTSANPTHNADGGFHVNGVRQFADGGYGENGRYYQRQSQIVPGGANILWGEKETGWEAYISGKPGMRDRNLAVLSEAASRLGASVTAYANGGTRGERFGVEAGGIGALSLQQRINRINRSLDNLNGSIRSTNRAINAQEKVVERETRARQDLVSSTRSALTRDIWDTEQNWNSRFAAGSVGAATRQLQQQRAEANEMNRILNALQRRGLDGAAFADIAGGGIDRARMFAGQSRGQLAQFERLFNQRNAAVNRAASTAGDSAATTGELRTLNRQVNQMEKRNRQAEKRKERLQARRDKLRERRADRRSERNAKQTGREVRNSANKGRRNRR